MSPTGLSRKTAEPWGVWNTTRRGLRSASIKPSRRGFSLVEMVVALAIILIMMAVALPFLFGNRRSYHLTQASTAASGAIQATRYQAIMTGCSYNITFTVGLTTYQVQNQPLSGTPPACSGTWSNLGAATPWSTTADVTMSPTTTLQFDPNGTVSVTSGSSSLVFSNGFTTNTVIVSGVGNVKVTQP